MDVHLLISASADALARRRWRESGARTCAEYRGFCIAAFRRRVGMAAVQAFARHRLNRVPFIGVPRTAVRQRMDDLARQRQQRRLPNQAAMAAGRAEVIDPQEFYAHQVHVPVAVAH